MRCSIYFFILGHPNKGKISLIFKSEIIQGKNLEAIGILSALIKCEFEAAPSLSQSLIRSLMESGESKISGAIAATLLSMAKSNISLFLPLHPTLVNLYRSAKIKDVRIALLEILLLFE